MPPRLTIAVCLTFGILALSGLQAKVLPPKDFAEKVIGQILLQEQQQKNLFLNLYYGGAIIFDAIQRAADTFDLPNVPGILYKYLDEFQQDPSSNVYKILHDETIPFWKSVGDNVGVFPIAYLNRALREANNPSYSNTSDLKIVKDVAEKYILPYPHHLDDGTFSRHEGWDDEPDKNASFVWCDDQYMGLTLIARIARVFDRTDYAYLAGKMAIQFAHYMQDDTNGLFFHGYNDADHKQSPCKWARANGWGMMAHMEVLEALAHFPILKNSPVFYELLKIFQEHSLGVLQSQTLNDGRWHQVLDEPATFLETSASAMFLSSIIRGVRRGWLDKETFSTYMIPNGWSGLQKTIMADGKVTGICTGTGIGVKWQDYETRSTAYNISQPGLGSVIHALVDLHHFYNEQ